MKFKNVQALQLTPMENRYHLITKSSKEGLRALGKKVQRQKHTRTLPTEARGRGPHGPQAWAVGSPRGKAGGDQHLLREFGVRAHSWFSWL